MADSDIFVSNDIELDVDFGEIFVIDQGVVTKVVAKKYDPTKTYVVGEYVIHLEKLYKCVTAIEEPEEFDSEKWTQVLLADEVQIANANITLKANASDVYAKSEAYNKTEVDTALASKADANTTYSKTEVDTALASKADTATTYTKTEVDTALGDKADKSDTYTKTEVDTALSAKANSDDVYAKTDTYSKDEIDTNIYTKSETYNKNEVDGIINNLPAPMIFKGTLGVNGTITDLPTASDDNEGHTYKVITDGTYASQVAKVGDIFTSNGTAWVYIPSGDETFTDTWRSIKVNGTEKLSGSITGGSVDFKNGTNSTAVFDPSDNSIKVNVDGYTQAQVDTKLSAKANQADVTTALNNKADKSTTYTKTEVNSALALKADKSTTYTKTEVDNLVNLISTAQGEIASFETNLAEPLQSVKCEINASGGNGTPDNPIPIVGYSSANITRCGVNLFDGTKVTTTHPSNWDVSFENNNLIIEHKTAYSTGVPSIDFNLFGTFIILFTATQDYKCSLYENGSYKQILNNGTQFTTTRGNTYSIIFGADGNTTNIFSNVQIKTGNTASEYAPYNGQTYTIAFGQTVYGGVLDVTRGKLKPCIEYPSYNGETLSGRWLSSEATYVEGTTPPTGSQVVSLDDYGTDIDLTPVKIRALVGENNVFADCGETEVEYINSNAEDTVDIAKSVIEQTNLSDLADIPNPPTADGNYRLKVTILNGKAIYSWEEIT